MSQKRFAVLEKGRKRAAKKADVLTTLRVIGMSLSCEPIPLPEGYVAQGHTRVTLHALTEKNEPCSFDVSIETFERHLAAVLPIKR